ncbi:hypothetical protein M426DRAFT_11252 [Hypoxylon sp. CI-4A]|nr:hypothetical protein M426DRAFT_11252 [Hypoxylon sp. CI-4A]
MYARYVPPPKGAARSPEPQNTIEPSSNISEKTQPTSYARYIPPPKLTNGQSSPPTSRHVHFGENDESLEPPTKKVRLAESEDADKIKKKSKESKKSKKETQSNAEVANGLDEDESIAQPTTQDGPSENDTFMEPSVMDQEVPQDSIADAPSETVEKVKKEKEKKNKKAKKKKSETEAPADIEDETPSRHRAVLEKAAKFIRAPEPQPVAEQEEEDVSMQDAPGDGDSKDSKDTDAMELDDTNEPEVHGLQPLPQPKPVAIDSTKPAYETLPPWLAKPVRVSPQATAPFTSLGISPEFGITPQVAERLAAKGYSQAFAVQTAVIPLLLPHHDKKMHGDVLVSAATGSGKTLAYALPVIRDLSQGSRHLTRLRAVIVLPTRELVKQVQQVCEQCASIFSLDGSKKRARIGIAMGSQSFAQEQSSLVERYEKYDPEAYAKRNKRRAYESGYGSGEDSDEGYNTEDEERAAIRKREDKIKTLPDHVISYASKVDLLISTPGRLVEHIKYTPGFSLDLVRWLVVDEADKLLGQTFQQWLDVVIPRLQNNDSGDRNFKQSNLSGVRKIVLSATMTRDLDQLEGLKLRWPKLIMLEGSGATNEQDAPVSQAELVLPEQLQEAALKVSDPNLKPLFLVDLLQSDHLFGKVSSSKVRQDPSDDDTSSSESDSDSASASASDSESDSDADTSFKSSNATTKRSMPSILIFTKSNETALRLSRLISILSPSLGSLVGTLTSTTQYATRRRTIRSFLAEKLRILVASDLVARGIDLPSLDHVVNYDMPSSVASYVHRVGRTARAGKSGKAWTLFTNPEARWFWNQIAGEGVIQRGGKVERIRVTEEKEDAFEKKVEAYESALAKLGEEANESRHRTR